jgi:hypothetical protein
MATIISWCMVIIVWPSPARGTSDGCVSERGRGLDPSGYEVVVAGVIVGNTLDPEHSVSPAEEADPWNPQTRPVVAVTLRPVAAWKGVPIGTRTLELSVPASHSYPGFETGAFRLLLADNPGSGADVQLPEVKAYCSHLHSVADLFSRQLRGMKWINTPEWYLVTEEASPAEPPSPASRSLGRPAGAAARLESSPRPRVP